MEIADHFHAEFGSRRLTIGKAKHRGRTMMTTDQKIDEVLTAVREQGERTDHRFDEVFKLIQEQRELILEDRTLNAKRFSQMEGSIGQLRMEVGEMNVGLNKKIDQMSADMLGLSEELYETKRRFGRSGKKLPS